MLRNIQFDIQGLTIALGVSQCDKLELIEKINNFDFHDDLKFPQGSEGTFLRYEADGSVYTKAVKEKPEPVPSLEEPENSASEDAAASASENRGTCYGADFGGVVCVGFYDQGADTGLNDTNTASSKKTVEQAKHDNKTTKLKEQVSQYAPIPICIDFGVDTRKISAVTLYLNGMYTLERSLGKYRKGFIKCGLSTEKQGSYGFSAPQGALQGVY